MKKNFKLTFLTIIFTLAFFSYGTIEQSSPKTQSILACKDCK